MNPQLSDALIVLIAVLIAVAIAGVFACAGFWAGRMTVNQPVSLPRLTEDKTDEIGSEYDVYDEALRGTVETVKEQ